MSVPGPKRASDELMLHRWVAAFAVVVTALSLPATAHAEGRSVVELVADGDLRGARAAVIAALGEDLPPDERAANLELLVIIERWSRFVSRPRAHVEDDDQPIPDDADWTTSFASAREALVESRFDAAAARLDALARSAPDATSRARAERLATLARAIKAHDFAAPIAQSAATAPPPDVPTDVTTNDREWYGWETLICDGASIVTSPLLIGIGGYVLCAPIVHLGNGEPVKALASFGLRLGAPVGLGIGFAAIEIGTHNGRCEFGCGFTGLFVGAGIGIVSAIAIDAAALARKDVRKTQKGSAIVPTGSARGDRVELGVAGTF